VSNAQHSNLEHSIYMLAAEQKRLVEVVYQLLMERQAARIEGQEAMALLIASINGLTELVGEASSDLRNVLEEQRDGIRDLGAELANSADLLSATLTKRTPAV